MRILASGDIGPDAKLLQPDPDAPAGFDYVISESTYGDRERPATTPDARRARLAEEVRDAATRKGALLIPAFAVERTQELLVDLVDLMDRGDIPATPIFLDSPLAIRATEVFRRHAESLDPAVDVRRLLNSQQLRFTETVEESKAINSIRGGAVIMVGSANANEGKTTLSLSLTRAYSLSGQRTLLIDCDLRKPSVHAHLGVEPSARLLDYLNDASDGAKLDSLPMTDHLSEAKVVIGARRADMEGRQVITGEYFGRLIEAAKERFDIVLLDTPPVGAVVDGLHLAQFADVIVLSTRYATTSQRDARAALNALSDAKRDDVEILGVLSMAEQSKRANRKRYGSYYSDY